MSAPPHPTATPPATRPAAGSAAPADRRGGSPGGGRRLSFDVLRVVFVLLVVLYHGTFIGPLVYHDIIPRNLVFPHQVGASLLLVISAYFVAATVRKHGCREGSARWWWGKLARLIPAFVAATVLAYLALRFLAPGGWYVPTQGDLVANLLMLWQWNGLWHWDYVDGSYWTIPLQLMAFTVAALIWRTRLGRGTGLRVLMWAALLLPLAQWWYRLHQPNTLYATLVDGLGMHRWHLFVAGIAVWMFSTGRLGRPHVVALLGTAMIAHVVHTGWMLPEGGVDFDHPAALGVSLGMLAVLAAAVGPDWTPLVPRALRPMITWLAGISYGVFLVHQTLGYVFMRRIQELGAGPTLQTAALLVMAAALGWLITRLVEQPTHRRLLALWDAVSAGSGRAVAPAAAPTAATNVPAQPLPSADAPATRPVTVLATASVARPVSPSPGGGASSSRS